MARVGRAKLLVRLSVSALLVSFFTIFLALWRSDASALLLAATAAAVPRSSSTAGLLLVSDQNDGRRENVDGTDVVVGGGPLLREMAGKKSRDGNLASGNVGSTTGVGTSANASRIVLTLVVCGGRFNESLVVMKSAITLAPNTPLLIIIITEDAMRPRFQNEFAKWPENVQRRVEISLRPLSFPQDGTANEWKNLFKLCASQRLFIPSLLSDVDATLYVDTDVVFLQPIDQIWSLFERMNSSQLAAMTPENEDYATGWYNRFARHPYFKPLGINSGVMLMNLTRMRAFNWERRLAPIFRKYKQKITWGDQDILNILFNQHPDKLYVYPCRWNYRTDHCMYTSVCPSAEQDGVAIAHGNRGVFHTNKQPTFRVLYETFQRYQLGQPLRTHLLDPLRKNLQQTAHTNCGKVYPLLLRYLERFARTLDDNR